MSSKSTLLTERTFPVTENLKANDGSRITWFTPQQYLKDKYKSVIAVELSDTTSSAGNWSGYFLQRSGHNIYAIEFHQENNHPGQGFTLYTGKTFAHCLPKDFKKFKESLPTIYKEQFS